VEDAAEADGVLEEAVDVEHCSIGAGVGDVVYVRHHLLAHPRRGDPPPTYLRDHRRLRPGPNRPSDNLSSPTNFPENYVFIWFSFCCCCFRKEKKSEIGFLFRRRRMHASGPACGFSTRRNRNPRYTIVMVSDFTIQSSSNWQMSL
jgi:hypothetical protein